jgi:hypothetical protein
MLYKLGALSENEDTEYHYEDRFTIEQTTGPDRLCIGAAKRHSDLLLGLVEPLKSPFYLLYLLHTPRRPHRAARYQSSALEWTEVVSSLRRFQSFLEQDARHDLWLHAVGDQATLVWDRHNLIYAYGPLPQFETILKQHGFVQGFISVPVPHAHHYHTIFDADEDQLLNFFDWRARPLQPEDEQ